MNAIAIANVSTKTKSTYARGAFFKTFLITPPAHSLTFSRARNVFQKNVREIFDLWTNPNLVSKSLLAPKMFEKLTSDDYQKGVNAGIIIGSHTVYRIRKAQPNLNGKSWKSLVAHTTKGAKLLRNINSSYVLGTYQIVGVVTVGWNSFEYFKCRLEGFFPFIPGIRTCWWLLC